MTCMICKLNKRKLESGDFPLEVLLSLKQNKNDFRVVYVVTDNT